MQKTTNPWPMIFPLISCYLHAAHREGQRFPKTRALIIKSHMPDLHREPLAIAFHSLLHSLCFQEAAWVRVDSTYSMNPVYLHLHLGTEQTREPGENQSWGMRTLQARHASRDSLELRITQNVWVTLLRQRVDLRDITNRGLRGRRS